MKAEFPIVEEYFVAGEVDAAEMDVLWAQGWRHFGPYFFRYSVTQENETWQLVQPLRVLLNGEPKEDKRHRRIRQRNAGIELRIEPPGIDTERHELFERHKQRFTRNVPDSLDDFLGPAPGQCPCPMVEVAAYIDGRLAAASYLDIGRDSVSSVYAIFDPSEARRGLGIATMLWEMDYARSLRRRFYYPGYAFHTPSSMDYKKQFPQTEWFDWIGSQWRAAPDARSGTLARSR